MPKIISEEQRKKISESMKGRKLSAVEFLDIRIAVTCIGGRTVDNILAEVAKVNGVLAYCELEDAWDAGEWKGVPERVCLLKEVKGAERKRHQEVESKIEAHVHQRMAEEFGPEWKAMPMRKGSIAARTCGFFAGGGKQDGNDGIDYCDLDVRTNVGKRYNELIWEAWLEITRKEENER